MVCVCVAELPHASVKVQVLVIISGQLPPFETSVPATEPATAQLSVYPRFVIAGISAVHETVTELGADAKTGAIIS